MGPIIRCLTGHPSWKPFRDLVPVNDEADMLLCNTHVAPPEFGSSPALENRHLAMTTYGVELVSVAALRLVKEATRSSSRNAGGSDDWWGCEVLLFAVDAEYEGQGIVKRQLQVIYDFCEAHSVPQLVVLSSQPAKPVDSPVDGNWWLRVSPTSGAKVMAGARAVNDLSDASLLKTFLLPWSLSSDREDRDFCLLMKQVGEDEEEADEAAESSAETRAANANAAFWRKKRRVSIEFCSGSRRLSNDFCEAPEFGSSPALWR